MTQKIGRSIFRSLTEGGRLRKSPDMVTPLLSLSINPLSPKIQVQILQTDLHTFLLRIVEIIWFKIKVFSLWSSI